MKLKDAARIALERLKVPESDIQGHLRFAALSSPDSPEVDVPPDMEEVMIQSIQNMYSYYNSTPERQEELQKKLKQYASKN